MVGQADSIIVVICLCLNIMLCCRKSLLIIDISNNAFSLPLIDWLLFIILLDVWYKFQTIMS